MLHTSSTIFLEKVLFPAAQKRGVFGKNVTNEDINFLRKSSECVRSESSGLAKTIEDVKDVASRPIKQNFSESEEDLLKHLEYWKSQAWKASAAQAELCTVSGEDGLRKKLAAEFAAAELKTRNLETLEESLIELDQSDRPPEPSDAEQILFRLVAALGVAAALGWDQDVEITVKLVEKVSDTVARWAQKSGVYSDVLSGEVQNKNRRIFNILGLWRACCINEVLKRNELLWEATDEETFFEATSCVANVLKELIDIYEVLTNVGLMFDSAMQVLLHQSQQMAGLEKSYQEVNQMFTALEYTPFILENANAWSSTILLYSKKLRGLTCQIVEFLRNTFDNASSTKAIAILTRLARGKFSDEIANLLKAQRVAVLRRILEEIETAAKFIETDVATDEIFFPPAAGAIFRERMLFQKLKKSVINGLSMEGNEDQELRDQVMKDFKKLAKVFSRFEDSHLSAYSNSISTEVDQLLYTPILRVCGSGEEYEVNFPEKLGTAMNEAYFMIMLQLQIPERAQLLVMKKTAWFLNAQTLADFLREFQNTKKRLRDYELVLLGPEIDAIEREMTKGSRYVTWSSGCLRKYLRDLNEPVEALHKTVETMDKFNELIDAKLKILEEEKIHVSGECMAVKGNVNGVWPSLLKLKVSKIKDLFQDYVKDVSADMEFAFDRVRSVIVEIESLAQGLKDALQDNEFDHQRFVGYFESVQKRCLDGVSGIILRTLKEYCSMLQGCKSTLSVKVTLVQGYPSLDPPIGDLHQMLNVLPKLIIEKTKGIEMSGICQSHDDTSSSSKWNFHGTITEDGGILALIDRIQTKSREIVEGVGHKLKEWRKYETLWKADKGATVKSYRRSNPSLELWDEKLQFYYEIGEDLKNVPSTKTDGPVLIYQENILEATIGHCSSWIRILGNSLQLLLSEVCSDLKERLLAGNEDFTIQDIELSWTKIMNMTILLEYYGSEVKPEVAKLVEVCSKAVKEVR